MGSYNKVALRSREQVALSSLKGKGWSRIRQIGSDMNTLRGLWEKGKVHRTRVGYKYYWCLNEFPFSPEALAVLKLFRRRTLLGGLTLTTLLEKSKLDGAALERALDELKSYGFVQEVDGLCKGLDPYFDTPMKNVKKRAKFTFTPESKYCPISIVPESTLKALKTPATASVKKSYEDSKPIPPAYVPTLPRKGLTTSNPFDLVLTVEFLLKRVQELEIKVFSLEKSAKVQQGG